MSTRFTVSSVSKLLFHFRCTVSCEALNALEERDADWRKENDALRAENRTVDADYRELLLRYRWMEEELSKQTCLRRSMEEDIECLTEKERWLQGKVRCLETEVLNLGIAKKEELDRVSKEKAVLEAKLHEAGVQLAKHQSLIRTVDDMKKEIDDFEYALGQVEFEKNEGTSNDKVRVERHGGTVRASEVSQREKKELKFEVCNVKREKSDDIRRISNKKMLVEAERRRLEEKQKVKIQELNRRVEALETEKGEIEAELRRIQSARSTETERILNEKTALEIQNRKTEEEMKEKIFQVDNKCKVMEDELCHVLHEKIVSKDKISELVSRIEVLEAELTKANQNKKSEIERIMKEKMALEVERRTAEGRIKNLEIGKRQSKMSNREKQQLINKMVKEKKTLLAEMWELKEEMGAQVFKAKTDKKDESERLSMLEVALEDQKSRMQEAEKQVSEISKTIKDLKREKGALEAQVREKSEEIKMILKDKMDLEAEKRIMEEEEKRKFLELSKRVDVLMREKIEMEAEFCQANKDKSEEIKKSLDLANRIGLLETEKQRLEAEIMDKGEVIKVVAEENSCLENVIKKLNMELSNILALKFKKVEEVQLSQPVYHPGNVGMLTTSWQTQGEGKRTVGACKRKRTNVWKGKHKRPFSEGSSSGGEVEDDTSENRKHGIWEVEEDLLGAFDSSPELCLKAVCALYRQHLLLVGDHPVFKPGYSSKAVTLAEYLVDEDPEKRLRKTVADLERLDPLAVVECRDIAKQHYKQLFQIYNKNKQDPSFRS